MHINVQLTDPLLPPQLLRCFGLNKLNSCQNRYWNKPNLQHVYTRAVNRVKILIAINRTLIVKLSIHRFKERVYILDKSGCHTEQDHVCTSI